MAIRFDLNTLRLFITVAEEGSIAKAAEREHIVASAISKRISDFERSLGTVLLQRNSRGIVITPAGQVALSHSRKLLRDLSQFESEIIEHSKGLRGQVTVYANSTAILTYLPRQLVSFLAYYPLVQIEIEEGISPNVLKAVSENVAEIGICGGNIAPSPGLCVLPYRDDRLSVVVPRGHPIGGRGQVKFADIVDYDFVGLQAGSSIDALAEHAAMELGKVLKLRIRTAGFDPQCRMVEAGLGIGLMPSNIAAHYARTLDINEFALNEPWAPRSLKLVTRDASELTIAARLLLNHLANPAT